jgi:hypothetical protein
MKFGQRRTMAGIGIILLVTLLVGAHTEAVAASRNADPTASPDVLLYAETDLTGLWPEEMTRIFSDGSSTTPFRVPAHKVLVVTDITWTGQGTNASAIASPLIINLQDNQKIQNGPAAGFKFEAPVGGPQTITQTFSTGFVVSEQAKIQPFFNSKGIITPGDLGQFKVWVMGYLRAAP